MNGDYGTALSTHEEPMRKYEMVLRDVNSKFIALDKRIDEFQQREGFDHGLTERIKELAEHNIMSQFNSNLNRSDSEKIEQIERSYFDLNKSDYALTDEFVSFYTVFYNACVDNYSRIDELKKSIDQFDITQTYNRVLKEVQVFEKDKSHKEKIEHIYETLEYFINLLENGQIDEIAGEQTEEREAWPRMRMCDNFEILSGRRLSSFSIQDFYHLEYLQDMLNQAIKTIAACYASMVKANCMSDPNDPRWNDFFKRYKEEIVELTLKQHSFIFNCKPPLDYYLKTAEDFICSLGQRTEVRSIKNNMKAGIKEILSADAGLQKKFNPLIAKLEKEISAGNEVGSHFLTSFSGTLAANLHEIKPVEKRNQIAAKLRALIAKNLAEIAPTAIQANPTLLSLWLAFGEAHGEQMNYDKNLAEVAPAAIKANPSLLNPWLAFCEAHYEQKDYEKMVAPLFLNCCEPESV
jgi:hypothetical protein